MAYASDESGRNEIYVVSFPEPHGATRISTDGGMQTEWRRVGRELFYRTPDRKLMAGPIKVGASFDAGKRQELFERRRSGCKAGQISAFTHRPRTVSDS